MRYQPLHDRVIIQQAEEAQTTAGGLVIPDIAQQQKHVAYGVVLAIGVPHSPQV